jgi:hypothetical protein
MHGQDVRMTAQGSSRLSMSFAIPETALADCVERLHREFFRAPDADLFAAPPDSARMVVVGQLPEGASVGLRLGEAAV